MVHLAWVEATMSLPEMLICLLSSTKYWNCDHCFNCLRSCVSLLQVLRLTMVSLSFIMLMSWRQWLLLSISWPLTLTGTQLAGKCCTAYRTLFVYWELLCCKKHIFLLSLVGNCRFLESDSLHVSSSILCHYSISFDPLIWSFEWWAGLCLRQWPLCTRWRMGSTSGHSKGNCCTVYQGIGSSRYFELIKRVVYDLIASRL